MDNFDSKIQSVSSRRAQTGEGKKRDPFAGVYDDLHQVYSSSISRNESHRVHGFKDKK